MDGFFLSVIYTLHVIRTIPLIRLHGKKKNKNLQIVYFNLKKIYGFYVCTFTHKTIII